MSDHSDLSSSGSEGKSRPRSRSTRWGTVEDAADVARSSSENAAPSSGQDEKPAGQGPRNSSFGDRDRGRPENGRSSSLDRRGASGNRGSSSRNAERDSRGGFRKRDDRGAGGLHRGDRFQGRDERGSYGQRGSRDGERGRAGADFGSSGVRRVESREQDSTAQRGPRSWDSRGDERAKRQPEPPLPESITGQELDKEVRQQLRTLSKDNADGVAKHLVAAAEFLDEDPERALLHAQHAVSRAARVPAAREALGLVLYRSGEFAEALREFRTSRRLSGSDHLLPYMVDCERGLGRYERALELANSPEAQRLSENDNIELAIVVSGVRRDMGQARAAVVGLRLPALKRATTQPWAARLFYAYADALLDIDEVAEARQWFVKAEKVDAIGETDAADRIDQIDGFEMTDLAPEEDEVLDPRLAEIDLNEPFGSPRGGPQGEPR